MFRKFIKLISLIYILLFTLGLIHIISNTNNSDSSYISSLIFGIIFGLPMLIYLFVIIQKSILRKFLKHFAKYDDSILAGMSLNELINRRKIFLMDKYEVYGNQHALSSSQLRKAIKDINTHKRKGFWKWLINNKKSRTS